MLYHEPNSSLWDLSEPHVNDSGNISFCVLEDGEPESPWSWPFTVCGAPTLQGIAVVMVCAVYGWNFPWVGLIQRLGWYYPHQLEHQHRKASLIVHLGPVVPLAIIQLADFVTDLFVIDSMGWRSASAYSQDFVPAWMGACFICVSAWMTAFEAFCEGMLREQTVFVKLSQRVIFMLLVPLNLHLIYLGLLYASAEAAGNKERAGARHHLFLRSKLVEASVEAAPLALVTCVALLGEVDGDLATCRHCRDMVLYSTSVVLSLLSMSYGFWGNLTKEGGQELRRKYVRPLTFVCILLQITLTLGSLSIAMAAGSVGSSFVFAFFAVWYLLAFHFNRQNFGGMGYSVQVIRNSKLAGFHAEFNRRCTKIFFIVMLEIGVVMFSFKLALQLAVVDRVVTDPKAPHYPKPYAILNAWQRRERKDFIRQAVLLGVYRRVLCVAAAAYGLSIQWGTIRCTGLVLALLLDLVATCILHSTVWPRKLRKAPQGSVAPEANVTSSTLSEGAPTSNLPSEGSLFRLQCAENSDCVLACLKGPPSLILVKPTDRNKCVFEHAAALAAGGGERDGVPLTLSSHPGLAVVDAFAPDLLYGEVQLVELALGSADQAVRVRREKEFLERGDGKVLDVAHWQYVEGNHLLALIHRGRKHDRTHESGGGRDFTINDDGTISPSKAPQFVLGVETLGTEPAGVEAPDGRSRPHEPPGLNIDGARYGWADDLWAPTKAGSSKDVTKIVRRNAVSDEVHINTDCKDRVLDQLFGYSSEISSRKLSVRYSYDGGPVQTATTRAGAWAPVALHITRNGATTSCVGRSEGISVVRVGIAAKDDLRGLWRAWDVSDDGYFSIEPAHREGVTMEVNHFGHHGAELSLGMDWHDNSRFRITDVDDTTFMLAPKHAKECVVAAYGDGSAGMQVQLVAPQVSTPAAHARFSFVPVSPVDDYTFGSTLVASTGVQASPLEEHLELEHTTAKAAVKSQSDPKLLQAHDILEMFDAIAKREKAPRAMEELAHFAEQLLPELPSFDEKTIASINAALLSFDADYIQGEDGDPDCAVGCCNTLRALRKSGETSAPSDVEQALVSSHGGEHAPSVRTKDWKTPDTFPDCTLVERRAAECITLLPEVVQALRAGQTTPLLLASPPGCAIVPKTDDPKRIQELGVSCQQLGVGPAAEALHARMQDQFILSQHPSTRDYVLDVPYATYEVHCEGEHGKLPLAVISFDDRSKNLDADASRTFVMNVDNSISPTKATHLAFGFREAEWEHPMRVVHLRNALRQDVWETKPTFFGDKSKRTEGAMYRFSHNAETADWFVSHAWSDSDGGGGAIKAQMLRGFLMLHDMVAYSCVALLLLAVFLLPLGFAIDSFIDANFGVSSVWVRWLFFGLPLVTLAGVWLWILGAKYCGCVYAAPWALSPRTLWLDRFCMDQSNPQTIAAGVAGFSRFLQRSDGMIAFVSKCYFSRLWCVYELAMFCRNKTDTELDEKLILLSLNWPSVYWTFLTRIFLCSKSAQLTSAEHAWLTDFRCKKAGAYSPRDRATVLATIRAKWGSEEAFEKFVHKRLPEILARSKRRYEGRLLLVAGQALDTLFHA